MPAPFFVLREHKYTSSDELHVGDGVLVADTINGHVARLIVGEVTHMLKTKFAVSFDNGSYSEYRTGSFMGSVQPYRSGRKVWDRLVTDMYRLNDTTRAWAAVETKVIEAASLRGAITQRADKDTALVSGMDDTLGAAESLAEMVGRLVDVEREIAELTAGETREEQEQEQEQEQ